MSTKKEFLLLVISDLIFINLAWFLYYYIRIESGWIIYANPPSFFFPMIAMYIYWTILFYIFGLYKHWFVRSRFEEFINIFRIVTIGCLIIFFAIYIDDLLKNAQVISRLLIVLYWIFLLVLISIGRLTIRSFQFSLLKKGIGLSNSIVIGSGNKAREVKDMIYEYPKLGYKFMGYVKINPEDSSEEELGNIEELDSIINKYKIDNVIIATDHKYEELIIKTMNICADKDVSIKIVPEVYEIVSGMVRSEQVHGIPLVQIKTELMPETSKIIKRLFDFIFSLFILIITSPIFLIVYILLKISGVKQTISRDVKIGLYGKEFNSYIFNLPANKLGVFLLNKKFYVLPKFFNVLKNDMSLVGPHAEDKIRYQKIKQEIPYYSRRLKVKPGITGWAKVKKSMYKEDYDFKKNLQYDFYYLENMSLLLDFKIIINTIILLITPQPKVYE